MYTENYFNSKSKQNKKMIENIQQKSIDGGQDLVKKGFSKGEKNLMKVGDFPSFKSIACVHVCVCECVPTVHSIQD